MGRGEPRGLVTAVARGALPLLVTVTLLGCAQESTVESNTNRTVGFEADEGDIGQARFEQSEGRSRWETAAVTDYTMAVGYTGLGTIEIEFSDEIAVSTTVVADGEEAAWLVDRGLPLTVEEAFEQADTIIDATAASSTPPDGNCDARYFTIRWDAELGYPAYYDGLGPCEDGVGVTITITPTNEG